ncbi:prominin-like protein isoform X1 [Drosophila miranda]|uniref:prominin-like protein isoform X1 n=2 Tax=Drosophila miranda TaxID=7229 RepID=UPI00143F641F|nr:prominin-like protein isoform X1 [Drosophila miranda]
MKRTISYATFWLCPYRHCYDFAHNNRLQQIDTSSCLHFDLIPNTTVYVRAMEKIMNDRDRGIPKRGIVRLNKIKVRISKQLNLVVPGLTKSISDGRLRYWEKATEIRDMIESVISELDLSTVSSTRTFDDVYEMVGPDGSAVNQILIMLILIIIVVLSTALICGCFGSTRRAPGRSGFCSKAMAATCLLIAIILIFCVFSFIALVGLFYMMIGIACDTAHGEDGINLFRQLDTLMDLNRFMPRNGDDGPSSRTLSVSNSIRACYANESIFGLLIVKHVFDISDLRSREILVSVKESVPVFTEDFSQLFLLTPDEKIKLNEMRKANLSEYHSIQYDRHLCTRFLHTDMNVLANKLYSMTNFLDANAVRSASFSFKLDFLSAQQYQEHLSAPLRRCVIKMVEKLKLIDSLILFENQNFGETIKTLLDAVERSEKFIQILGTNFINVLAKNLTAVINERIKDYVERVIWESMTNVGRCQPLAYIYYQGVHFVCARLVDPINAFWLATIICALLLLPILFVCHRLMCLYLRIYPAPIDDAAGGVVGGCPFCTGLPAPVTICQGGPFGARTDQAEAAAPVQTVPQVQRANKNPATERSKRKND